MKMNVFYAPKKHQNLTHDIVVNFDLNSECVPHTNHMPSEELHDICMSMSHKDYIYDTFKVLFCHFWSSFAIHYLLTLHGEE